MAFDKLEGEMKKNKNKGEGTKKKFQLIPSDRDELTKEVVDYVFHDGFFVQNINGIIPKWAEKASFVLASASLVSSFVCLMAYISGENMLLPLKILGTFSCFCASVWLMARIFTKLARNKCIARRRQKLTKQAALVLPSYLHSRLNVLETDLFGLCSDFERVRKAVDLNLQNLCKFRERLKLKVQHSDSKNIRIMLDGIGSCISEAELSRNRLERYKSKICAILSECGSFIDSRLGCYVEEEELYRDYARLTGQQKSLAQEAEEVMFRTTLQLAGKMNGFTSNLSAKAEEAGIMAALAVPTTGDCTQDLDRLAQMVESIVSIEVPTFDEIIEATP